MLSSFDLLCLFAVLSLPLSVREREREREVIADALLIWQIARIWRAQWNALSSTTEPMDDDFEDDDAVDAMTDMESALDPSRRLVGAASASAAASPSPAPPPSETDRTDNQSTRPRAIKIERRVTLPDGRQVWRSEVVEDQRVITVYLAARKKRETESDGAETPAKPIPEAVRKLQQQAQPRKSPSSSGGSASGSIKRLRIIAPTSASAPSSPPPPSSPGPSAPASPAPESSSAKYDSEADEPPATPTLKLRLRL